MKALQIVHARLPSCRINFLLFDYDGFVRISSVLESVDALFMSFPFSSSLVKGNALWRCFGRHLVGFFLFLGLTIYTVVTNPSIVDPETLERWKSGVIMESLPSYLQLPEALSSCVPGTFDGTRCIQVG